ncbi:hypothetical protein CS063_00845 [Sporanaerobium hydrogeniformans]|uniref:Uncharacterized protein n=1 Tax=Sporanaerobium hydrogeniformans TaxID=3072179 RepID=A0AC61DGW3_9FIRM|nr:hypothetical protein [Sporanaerobium hydrogeniformans]PHV72058.1 hypothetical protein CS063_00845 [Sporanaerobium hydrogeniformans]
MKTKSFWIGSLCFLILIGIFVYLQLTKLPTSTVLVNNLSCHVLNQLSLIYSDISLKTTRAFQYKANKLQPITTRYTSYGEGFLPWHTQKYYLNKVNTYRQNEGLVPFQNFYNYYEDKDIVILCFIGGLENIYVLNKQTQELSPLNYIAEDNLGTMYVFHIKRLNDSYILLGGEANAYASMIYEMDATSLTIRNKMYFKTSTLAISKQNCTLTAEGDAYFVQEKGLLLFCQKNKQLDEIPLSFSPQFVFSQENSTVAIAFTRDTLNYSLLDKAHEVIRTDKLPLPHPHSELLRGFLRNDKLYILYYNSYHPFYSNYICIYNLQTNTFDYCLALEAYKNLALLDIY